MQKLRTWEAFIILLHDYFGAVLIYGDGNSDDNLNYYFAFLSITLSVGRWKKSCNIIYGLFVVEEKVSIA